jgi:hypothetical protein
MSNTHEVSAQIRALGNWYKLFINKKNQFLDLHENFCPFKFGSGLYENKCSNLFMFGLDTDLLSLLSYNLDLTLDKPVCEQLFIVLAS